MRNSELDQTNQKLSQLQFNYSGSFQGKAGPEDKSVIIDVLDDMELGRAQQADKEDEIPIEVSRKYCTVCNLEQPIRTKHCRVCKK